MFGLLENAKAGSACDNSQLSEAANVAGVPAIAMTVAAAARRTLLLHAPPALQRHLLLLASHYNSAQGVLEWRQNSATAM